jgi:pimeloyl-ACP methyl ester carboxylesterase
MGSGRRSRPAPDAIDVDRLDMGRLKDIRARIRELGRELGAGVAGGVEDSGHSALYLRQLLRGNRARRAWRPRTEVPATPPGQPPVLLLHGYLATRGSLHLLERHLTERGLVVMTYALGPVHLGDIRDSAGLIARKVESIVAQTEVTRVDIVGHSMGGLVGLDYLKRLGGRHRVRRLIMLGTPAQGTWSALLGLVTAPLGLASLQLLPGSPFLRELAERPLPPGAEVVSIGAIRDWLAPLSTTVLDGIRHIALPTGHSGLLVDEEVAEVVAGLLLSASVDAAAGPP